jgi:DNA-binding response OmpR family regulator
MPVSDIVKAKLLFVDDDQSFLDFVKQMFEEFSHNQWEIACVTDAAHALAHLRRETVDLALLDLQMPGVDGLQLLRMLKREFPMLQLAFLTGQGDEKSRRIGLEEGAAMFLEKPAGLAGMESLFATINELARWQQRMGGRSVVRRAGLLDIVKMECKSKNSRIFEVFGPQDSGQIWIKEGTIIHALAPEKRGQSAFTHLVCLSNAEFHLKPFAEPIERSVTRDWEFIVLEASRVQEQLLNAPLPAEPAPADAAAPAPVPEPAPIKFPKPTPPPPAPSPMTAPAAGAFPPIAVTPATRSVTTEVESTGLQIMELLVSSERREVLYEWECPEPQKRLALIEFIVHKSRQLAQGLPLGRLDRVEFQSMTGRLVIQSHQHRNVLVRSNTRFRPAVATEGAPVRTVTEWLALQAPARGLLAFGIVLPDRKMLDQSFAPDFPLSAITSLWPAVVDTFDAATRMQFPSWQIRWVYERAQIYGTRRNDGTTFGALLARDPHSVDLEGVERMFEEFKTLRVA